MTYFEPTIKCLSLTPHPSLRNTFSPRAKAFVVCTIVYTKGNYMVPFQGSTERAPTKTKKLSLVVKQKKLNNLRDKVKFRLLNEQHVACSTYSLTLVAFAAKTAARLRTFLRITIFCHLHYIPPKLVCVNLANKLQTVKEHYQGWRGVTLQRHLNEGTAG